jgi:eukaryotic-like serine/threonine-protein kinase
MSQQIQHRNSGWPRTLHGSGDTDESTAIGDSWEPKFAPIGPRVGRSGQVFETDGRAGLVIKLFTWAAGLPVQVVRDFTREAMRVADLHHPHVAQVLDAGTLGDGTPFVVMERLAGMTLDEAANGRSLPIAEVLPILRGVGSALCAAHAAGVAHGELRADNVFIADVARYGPGYPKLLDFGVARLAAAARPIGRGVEELGLRAGERADQLALATLAWRLLGAMPPPGIQRVLLRGMSPDPSQRFGSVNALVEALEQASLNAATAGLTPKADAVRTLVGATIPVSTDAPRPGLASSPSSLTQQFFAEGEQLELAHAVGQTSDAGAGTEEEEEDELEIAAAPRVPRSRAQMIAVPLLALGSMAVIGWTIVSLASKPVGDPRAAESSPAPAVARPIAVSPAGTLRPAEATARGPRGKTVPVHRTPPVQPPAFAAPAKPWATGLEVPAPSRLFAAPVRTALPPGELSSPPTDATPAAAAAAPAEVPAPPPASALPVAPDGSRDDEEPQPAEQEGGEPHGATPAPSAPEEPAP